MSAQTAQADELRAPQYVQAEPSTPQSMALTTRAAIADMKGNPQQARDLANQAIRADPRDPWPYYNKGMALAQLGEIDAALAALYAAEKHFAPTDRWGHSVAIYGRGSCAQPGGPLCRSASRRTPNTRPTSARTIPAAADMARRYAVELPRARAARARAAAAERLTGRARAGQSVAPSPPAMASAPPSRHCGSGSDMEPVQVGSVKPPAGPALQVVVPVDPFALTIATSVSDWRRRSSS